MIVSTFGPEGPAKCSGLDVVRYDADSLHREFGMHFRLLESVKELHQTPFGTIQQFLYCHCRMNRVDLSFRLILKSLTQMGSPKKYAG